MAHPGGAAQSAKTIPQTTKEGAAALGKNVPPYVREENTLHWRSAQRMGQPTPNARSSRPSPVNIQTASAGYAMARARCITRNADGASRAKRKAESQPNPNSIPPHSTIETQHLQSGPRAPKRNRNRTRTSHHRERSYVPRDPSQTRRRRPIRPSKQRRQRCKMRWGWQHSRTLAPDLRSSLSGAVPPHKKRGPVRFRGLGRTTNGAGGEKGRRGTVGESGPQPATPSHQQAPPVMF